MVWIHVIRISNPLNGILNPFRVEVTRRVRKAIPKQQKHKFKFFKELSPGTTSVAETTSLFQATLGDKQRKLDEKYIQQYRIHKAGLFMPDNLIKGADRQRALHLLSKGHTRAIGRLAADSAMSEQTERRQT